jgi:GDP-mannose 6-dehydrogenase
VRALEHSSRSLDLDLPVISSILESNRQHLLACLELIMSFPGRKVALLGLSFKAGTDDLRESPIVDIAEYLLGKGYEVRIFDPNVQLSKLVGANRHYLAEHLPHISRLLVHDASELLDSNQTFVLGNNDPALLDVVGRLNAGSNLVDLVNSEIIPPPGVSVYSAAAT